jgi:exodeoxyribonuclease V alpha subunit
MARAAASKRDATGRNPEKIGTVIAAKIENPIMSVAHSVMGRLATIWMPARGKRDFITVIGHAATISAGEFIQASGEWINDRTHGVQLPARFLKAMPPTTVEGIEKCLGSGMIRGIGPPAAAKDRARSGNDAALGHCSGRL